MSEIKDPSENGSMWSESKSGLTIMLRAWSNGDRAALEKLTPLVYKELHRLARVYMSGERPGHVLQPSALINEAYLRLIDWKNVHWKNRAHFFGAAASLMRHILIDLVRKDSSTKRGSGARAVPLDDTLVISKGGGEAVLAVHEALDRLAAIDVRQARIVELRFFGGLTTEEAAAILEISTATVENDWKLAKVWLKRELSHG